MEKRQTTRLENAILNIAFLQAHIWCLYMYIYAKEDPLHGIHVQTPYILQAFRGQKFSSHGSGAGKVGICQLELLGLFHLDPAEHPMQLVWQ